ncbi:RluA family pseudouridine synthase [Vibrio sp. SCSIO 43136]|uniref:RluA family pseudouridine synthase n=1 Tax=Vibrio sp. SCSIO 43136 TaxID=2819101 RepID=UPI00207590C9|nr:RluA family pseudouridine synthase [Vibrio sp. SCSIO 43136]USD67980.1 RNA pseudouridine synthase [Vibrio sp. SCSIO 43136]
MHCFTRFQTSTEDISLPEQFTFPFYYTPHALCELAADELKQHLTTQNQWQHNFGAPHEPEQNATGKMFGVLIVKSPQGEIGYLKAYSGKIADSNHLPGFVPPVYDMLDEDGFFRSETHAINDINRQINTLKANPEIDALKQTLAEQTAQGEAEIEAFRQVMIEGRARRKKLRADAEQNLTGDALEQVMSELGKESIAEKYRIKDLKRDHKNNIDSVESKLNLLQQEIGTLQELRAKRSNALQHRLFSNYTFLNANGENKALTEIFDETIPAGSGECAAPKLLQYAYLHNLTPIAMAEFWWGVSPKSEVRQHGRFYPSCKAKCEPILGHMLVGLDVEANPLLTNPAQGKEIEVLYQDEAIVVVNKPAEFLSVPGKHIKDSVYTRVCEMFPDIEGPFVIHRLDMSTSGILIFALTRRANKSLQKQFITREVGKRYVATIEGVLDKQSGEINLPLRGDLDDRPRQLVCYEHGKAAHTSFEVIERYENATKLYLHPHTGRTHQLRVHCAHQQGLNMPIIGDDLYGTKANRLHLHAQRLEIAHPYTKEPMVFEVTEGF